MDETRFMDITRRVMSDQTLLPVNSSIMQAWFIVSALQLAVRHPELSSYMKDALSDIAKTFQGAIVNLHPDAQEPLDMGWNPAFDAPSSKQALKHVVNVWALYYDAKSAARHWAEHHRPQDWGDPKWMYRVYVLEAQGYRNEVHCWLDRQVADSKHLELFAGLVCTIMLPGTDPKLAGKDFLHEDDSWEPEWGVLPPFVPDSDGDFSDDDNDTSY